MSIIPPPLPATLAHTNPDDPNHIIKSTTIQPADATANPIPTVRQQRTSQRANPHTPSLPTPSSGPSSNIEIRRSNPIPLTAAQEAEVNELYYSRVRAACAAEVKAFAECCTGRTLSISWACRGQRRGMNDCMNSFAGRGEMDRAREGWFATLEERQKKREEEEEWKESQRKLKREWWGLDENGRRIQDGAVGGKVEGDGK